MAIAQENEIHELFKELKYGFHICLSFTPVQGNLMISSDFMGIRCACGVHEEIQAKHTHT